MARKGLISIFARHRVAANLLMFIMLLSGLWGVSRINVQFLPTFQTEIVGITVVWPGASAEDIENSITLPVEQALRDLDDVKRMTSTSKTSNAVINVEFKQHTDMRKAVEDVRERVSRITLPSEAESPTVFWREPYEQVARLIVSGPKTLAELRPLIRRFERELLDLGISKIELIGAPDEEIAIQVPSEKLVELNMSLPDIAKKIASRSVDIPAGIIGKSQIGRQLRSLEQGRSIEAFQELPLATDNPNQLVRLGDIATITRRAKTGEPIVSYNGDVAVQMQLLRSGNSNALASARILHNWLDQTRAQLGSSVSIKVYNENWQYITERINLLVKNGLGGLALIMLVLFLFLNRSVATWVAAGIPAAFMAALACVYLFGESINMVSLFAFIMALGIVVDDTIVVGEQALTNFQRGMPIRSAVETAATRMLSPIMASSLTTICAFLPLLMIGDIIGTILFAIPLVIICMIIASLLECFLVLPGHLAHSIKEDDTLEQSTMHTRVNEKFNHFKNHRYLKIITFALRYYWATIATALGLFIISVSLVVGGYINFTFFPSPEGRTLIANIQFTAGTPPKQIKRFLAQLIAQGLKD